MGRSTAARWALATYLALGAVYTIAAEVGGPSAPTIALKGLLMPTLLVWALLALGHETPRLLVAALMFATLGDVALEFDDAFLLGMAGFLAMQGCYVAGFLRLGAWSGLRERWPIAAGYGAFWVGANVALGPRLGDYRLPILVYSLALCAMAAVASGVGARVGAGGLLFLVSDMLIGLDLADLDFTGRGSVVMATYLAAQYLLVTGWARQVRRDVPVLL